MTIAQITALLIQFGPSAFDLIQKLVEKWNDTTPVTAADIEELRKLGQRSSRDAVIESLVRNNIALDTPEAIAILALVK